MFQKKIPGQTIYLIPFFLLTLTLRSNSQALTNRQGIDSLLEQRLGDKENVKESGTLVGQIKVYKKILGINTRIKKGEGYQEYILYKNRLLSHRDISIYFKSYGNDLKSEEYFYIDDKLVKYQMTIEKRNNESKVLSLKDSVIIYVDNAKVISSDTKEPISKTTIDHINGQAKIDLKLDWDTKPSR